MLALTSACTGFSLAGTARAPVRADVSPYSRVLVEASAHAASLDAMMPRTERFAEIARAQLHEWELLLKRKGALGDSLGPRLLAGTLRWGMQTAGDGALLALTSPSAYRIMNEWRRTCFGEVDQLSLTLEEASLKLARHVEYTCDLACTRVEHRAKGLMSTFSKAAGRGKRPRDIMAMRLVVPDGENGEEGEAACYAAMRACHRLWESTGEFKDYIAFPKENGYRSLHETVRLPCGRLMEVQIRSASMHDHAERGAAAHDRYKHDSYTRVLGALGGLQVA